MSTETASPTIPTAPTTPTAPTAPATETTQATQIAPPEETPRLLRRRADRRLLGGVSGGFADYTGADVGLIRVLVVALTLFGGAGIALYAAAWLLVPVEGSSRSPAERLLRR